MRPRFVEPITAEATIRDGFTVEPAENGGWVLRIKPPKNAEGLLMPPIKGAYTDDGDLILALTEMMAETAE